MLGRIKTLLRRHVPGTYLRAQRVRDRLRSEVRLLGRIGLAGVVRMHHGRTYVQSLMHTSQSIRRLILSEQSKDLDSFLAPLGDGPVWGSHAIYLSPDLLQTCGLGHLLRGYPRNSGLKIFRSRSSLAGDRYIFGSALASCQEAMAYNARALTTVSNALARLGVAPRVYDLCKVRVGDDEHYAFVMEHIPQAIRTSEAYLQGRISLDAILATGDFTLIDPDGSQGADFSPPDGNGNFRARQDGTVTYVDLQNFVFTDFAAFLSRRAEKWAESTHFGDVSLLRGGKYLYQSIPGLARSGKRDTESRAEQYQKLLQQARVAIHDKVILDIGSNLGQMSAFALHEGARWAHLWDLPETIAAADEALSLTGYTRFSGTGCSLVPDRDLTRDLPDHLCGLNPDDGIVFYLAIHHHVGWLERLGDLPWRHLVFEGHEGQSHARLESVLQDLQRRIPTRLLVVDLVKDGDSGVRPACVVERLR